MRVAQLRPCSLCARGTTQTLLSLCVWHNSDPALFERVAQLSSLCALNADEGVLQRRVLGNGAFDVRSDWVVKCVVNGR